MIAGAGDFDTAEARQMRRQELRVEEAVAAEPQSGSEMHEATLLASVTRLNMLSPKKRRTDRDAVEPRPGCRPATIRRCGPPAGEERRISRTISSLIHVLAAFGPSAQSADNILEGAVASESQSRRGATTRPQPMRTCNPSSAGSRDGADPPEEPGCRRFAIGKTPAA